MIAKKLSGNCCWSWSKECCNSSCKVFCIYFITLRSKRLAS